MSSQAGWILQDQVVPRLRSAIPRVANQVGAEDSEELVQDGIAIAAKMLHSVELAGKQVTPGNIAYYTIQHIKAGRRSTGSSVVDVMASHTQLNGSTRIHSLNEAVAEDEGGGEIYELQDVLSNDREDPATVAARKLDWDRFLDQLSHIEQLVVEFLSAGKTLRDVARKVGVCDSTMQHYRRQLAVKILEFMGAEVLQDSVRMPGWRINLDCEREAQACRNDRRALAA
jgi:DNA-binding NarL/FixJ family response regulator